MINVTRTLTTCTLFYIHHLKLYIRSSISPSRYSYTSITRFASVLSVRICCVRSYCSSCYSFTIVKVYTALFLHDSGGPYNFMYDSDYGGCSKLKIGQYIINGLRQTHSHYGELIGSRRMRFEICPNLSPWMTLKVRSQGHRINNLNISAVFHHKLIITFCPL